MHFMSLDDSFRIAMNLKVYRVEQNILFYDKILSARSGDEIKIKKVDIRSVWV